MTLSEMRAGIASGVIQNEHQDRMTNTTDGVTMVMMKYSRRRLNVNVARSWEKFPLKKKIWQRYYSGTSLIRTTTIITIIIITIIIITITMIITTTTIIVIMQILYFIPIPSRSIT